MNGEEIKALRELSEKVAHLSGTMEEHNKGAEQRKSDMVRVLEKQDATITKQTEEIIKINDRCLLNLPIMQQHIKNEEKRRNIWSDRRFQLFMAIIGGGWLLQIVMFFFMKFLDK